MEFFVPFLNTTYNPKNAPEIFSSEIHPKSTRALLVGGVLPPIWKICNRQIGSFPHKIGVNIKNIWNHHPVCIVWISRNVGHLVITPDIWKPTSHRFSDSRSSSWHGWCERYPCCKWFLCSVPQGGNKNNLITSILNGIWFQLFQPIIVLDAFNQFEAMMIELETSLLLKLQNSYTNYPKKSKTATILKFKQARRVSLQSICIERTCKSEYLYINPNYRVTSHLAPKTLLKLSFYKTSKENLLYTSNDCKQNQRFLLTRSLFWTPPLAARCRRNCALTSSGRNSVGSGSRSKVCSKSKESCLGLLEQYPSVDGRNPAHQL